MVLSRNSMGRLFTRSRLYFLTRKTCGLSASLTYQSSSPFFLPTSAVCCLPLFRPTVTVSSGESRPVSSGLASSANSLALKVASWETTPVATDLSNGSTLTLDSTTCQSAGAPPSCGAGLASTILAPLLVVTVSLSASFSSKPVMVLSRQAFVSLSSWYLNRLDTDHTSFLPSSRTMVIWFEVLPMRRSASTCSPFLTTARSESSPSSSSFWRLFWSDTTAPNSILARDSKTSLAASLSAG